MKRYFDTRLKVRHLRVIDAVGRSGGLMKAAALLGLSQPAITKTLNEIEAIMGARLFDRHPRGVVANALGKLATETARQVLVDLNRLERELSRRIEGGEGMVLCGALPAAATGLMPGAVARLQARYGDVRVEVIQGRTEDLMAALNVGEVDLVVGRLSQPAQPDAYERRPLYADTVAVLARAGHPLFCSPGPISVERLSAFQLAMPSTTTLASDEAAGFLRRLQLSRTDALQSNSLSFLREVLLSSDAISFLPRMMLAGDIARGDIREVAVLDAPNARICGVTLLRGRDLPQAAQLFIDTLKDYVGDLCIDPEAGVLTLPEEPAMADYSMLLP